jgi:UPF0176 protein
MSDKKEYQILLYYKYVEIEDPSAEMVRQRGLCEKYNLKSRIIVAKEGINGTLEGLIEDTEKYIEEMEKDDKFKGIDYKKSKGYGQAFPKISVKVRDEIVSLKLGDQDINPNVVTGKYITADELHELYQSGEEFYVVDMRNDYEQKVGHFENAFLMPMQNFRELPEKLEEIAHLKNKKVITTCTGGVRCEKASGFLVMNGFTDVYQLFGGMQTYIEKYPNSHFLGKLYVFDGRVVWSVNENDEDSKIISNCDLCGKVSADYVDCGYIHCAGHRHFIACADCRDENNYAFCSEECKGKAYAENAFCNKRYPILEKESKK